MSLTPEQKEARRAGIGGSESACIAGFPAFTKTIEVFRSKKDPDYERPASFSMELGDLFEDDILELAKRRTGLNISPNKTVFKHPTLPLVSTPDGLVPEPIVIEAKWCNEWMLADWGPDGSDLVPKPYLLQVQHNMFVLRACGIHVEEAKIALLIGTKELRVYTIRYAADMAEALARTLTAWWEKYVVRDVPPPPDGTPSYMDWLSATYPPPQRGAEIQAPHECGQWATQYRQARDRKKEAERLLREAEQNLCRSLGAEAESMVGNGWRASWRANKNGDRRFTFKVNGEAE